MYEWCVDAIVMDREDVGEADARLTLYTREFGRVSARAKSIRKITSKLSAHLGLGDMAKVRLIGKSEHAEHLQLVDALRTKKLDVSGEFLAFMKAVTFENDSDEELWNAFKEGARDKEKILAVMGLDPKRATCTNCANGPVNYFLASSHAFACHGCILMVGQNEVSYEI